LGHYDPRTKAKTLKADRIKYWLGLGATASNSVYNLLINNKIVTSDTKRHSVRISKKRAARMAEAKKSEAAAVEAAAKSAEAPAPAAETPAEAKSE